MNKITLIVFLVTAVGMSVARPGECNSINNNSHVELWPKKKRRQKLNWLNKYVWFLLEGERETDAASDEIEDSGKINTDTEWVSTPRSTVNSYRPQQGGSSRPTYFGPSFRELFDDLFSRFSPDFEDTDAIGGGKQDDNNAVSINRQVYRKSVICVQGECEIETCVNGKCEKKKGAMSLDWDQRDNDVKVHILQSRKFEIIAVEFPWARTLHTQK